MKDIREPIERGEIILMDGGIGTEIQRRGVAMNEHAWCGLAHVEAPEVVRQVHVDYIEAGAQVITANTFGTARHVLESCGHAGDVAKLNRGAVDLARQAREKAASGATVWIAGSMSSMPPLSRIDTTPTGATARDSYREQAHLLAEAGADLLVAEMMLDYDNAAIVIEAARETGLPLWVGYSAQAHPDHAELITWREDEYFGMPPEPFDAVVERMVSLGGDVVGVMHSKVAATGPALDVVRSHWSGPLLAYAETGRFVRPNWVFEELESPADYAGAATGWVAQGVQVVGGCCGTTPEHIRALASALSADRARTRAG